MYYTTGAFTVTGINKGIFFSSLIREANFASSLQFFLQMEDVFFRTINLLEIKRLSFLLVIDLKYDQFDSAQFYKVSNYYVSERYT